MSLKSFFGLLSTAVALTASLSGTTPKGYDPVTHTYLWDNGTWASTITLANLNPNENFKNAFVANRFNTYLAGKKHGDIITAVKIGFVDIVDWENDLFKIDPGFVPYRQDGRTIKIAIWDKNPIVFDVNTGISTRGADPIYTEKYTFANDFTDPTNGTQGIGNDYGSNRRPYNFTAQETYCDGIARALPHTRRENYPQPDPEPDGPNFTQQGTDQSKFYSEDINTGNGTPFSQYAVKFTSFKLKRAVPVKGNFWVGFITDIPAATVVDAKTTYEADLDWIGVSVVDTRQSQYQGVTGPAGIPFENNRVINSTNHSPVSLSFSDISGLPVTVNLNAYADEVATIRCVGCKD